MLVHDLTPIQCRELLSQTHVGRLACAHDNQPYVVPVYFYLDGEYLYSFATLGQKIEWMRANPKVCVEFDQIADEFQWRSVVVFGRYEELPLEMGYENSRARAQTLFQTRVDWWEQAVTRPTSVDHLDPVVYRIHIDRVTGRRGELTET